VNFVVGKLFAGRWNVSLQVMGIRDGRHLPPRTYEVRLSVGYHLPALGSAVDAGGPRPTAMRMGRSVPRTVDPIEAEALAGQLQKQPECALRKHPPTFREISTDFQDDGVHSGDPAGRDDETGPWSAPATDDGRRRHADATGVEGLRGAVQPRDQPARARSRGVWST
jgi:hypothetical protein